VHKDYLKSDDHARDARSLQGNEEDESAISPKIMYG